jgi:hypothetical protein
LRWAALVWILFKRQDKKQCSLERLEKEREVWGFVLCISIFVFFFPTLSFTLIDEEEDGGQGKKKQGGRERNRWRT